MRKVFFIEYKGKKNFYSKELEAILKSHLKNVKVVDLTETKYEDLDKESYWAIGRTALWNYLKKIDKYGFGVIPD